MQSTPRTWRRRRGRRADVGQACGSSLKLRTALRTGGSDAGNRSAAADAGRGGGGRGRVGEGWVAAVGGSVAAGPRAAGAAAALGAGLLRGLRKNRYITGTT